MCFESGVKGMALNLQADHVGVVVFGDDYAIHQVREGMRVSVGPTEVHSTPGDTAGL